MSVQQINSSRPPSLCLIFEAIGPYNAIGKIATMEVEAALAAGWNVSVVAQRLHESLQQRVDWLKLIVPRKFFAFQWLTARYFIRLAAGDLSRFDVIHGHQPQIADLCHIFQCHFLTRAAAERNCLIDSPRGPRRQLEKIQKALVLRAEDRCYSNWNARTHMLFNSELTKEAFGRYYSPPPSQEVLVYPSPSWLPVSAEEKRNARKQLGLPQMKPVVGFLGGRHERKGYKQIVSSLVGEKSITLLFGGLHAAGYNPVELKGHFLNVGLVENTSQFYAACDALVVASHFEPFGYVASEAVARGVPVIATREVGALPHLLEYKAGAFWEAGNRLQEPLNTILTNRSSFTDGCRRYTDAYSRRLHDSRLLQLYSTTVEQRESTTCR